MVSAAAVSKLVTELWSGVRALADEREVDLDLRLLGKPAELPGDTEELLMEVVRVLVESARSAQELHHVALELSYGPSSVSIRIEHDGTLDPTRRSDAEGAILTRYGDIGAIGGTLALASGRGYGLRLEVTAPYADSSSMAHDPDLGQAAPMLGRPATAPRSLSAAVEQLTAQESTTLNLLAAGLSNKEIAGRMHLGVGTVKFHLAQIYQKLGVQGRGRGAAVARARELGLIFD
jgi:DNA-binding CsgD family transcriptional regulator